jgi:hypothetical protein
MEESTLVADQVIEFLGELYLHEPNELQRRVQFRDYLQLLLRNKPRIVTYGQFHAHRCACGIFLTCGASSTEGCAQHPRCRGCDAGPFNLRQENRSMNIESA